MVLAARFAGPDSGGLEVLRVAVGLTVGFAALGSQRVRRSEAIRLLSRKWLVVLEGDWVVSAGG